MPITIAIDGHSACGKSTLAKALAKKLGFAYVDTGAMYRAVTLFFLENNIDWKDLELVEKALPNIQISFKNVAGKNHTFLNGRDVESEIRKMYISKKVSSVAKISQVRQAMVKFQHEMGKSGDLIMDGRDIGTVVFPDAELKIFLTAEVEERTRRRFEELKAKGQNVDFEDIRANLLERDHIDSNRKDSPLRQADDAVLIDNTHISPKEVINLVLEMVNEIPA